MATDICQLSSLVGVKPEHAVNLYNYLISKPQFSKPESRKALIRRLREALVKNVSIQGVCKPLEALFSISKVERPEDKDYSCSRENWQAGPENRKRGEKWLNTIYKSNLSTATDQFAAHKDFDFISREITYGFYLSDHSILTPLETELVTLAGIMIQNLPLETAWHLRGTRRVGVSMEDVELVQQCVSCLPDFEANLTVYRLRWWRNSVVPGCTKYHESQILSMRYRRSIERHP
jgi:hypothetical protein